MPCSVIIIAYNSRDFIPACLASVREALKGLDSEIIVLDNGSPFPLTQDVKDMFPEVVWLNSKENLGFGRGCNLAATHATKPYLFFIIRKDFSILPPASCVETMSIDFL